MADERGPSPWREAYRWWSLGERLRAAGGIVMLEKKDEGQSNVFTQTLEQVERRITESVMLPPEALTSEPRNGLPDRPFRYIVDKNMRVIATVGPVPCEALKMVPSEVLKEAWATLAVEAVRRVHREQYAGWPAVECPTDGQVAALHVDGRFGRWLVVCPLCGAEIYVGRFKVTLLLAYHERKRGPVEGQRPTPIHEPNPIIEALKKRNHAS